MRRNRTSVIALLGVIVLGGAGLSIGGQASAEQTSLANLAAATHFHGIAIDPNNVDRFFLATHHGLFVVDAKGKADRVGGSRDDFMGFTPHPTDPSRLFASGHPATGGNLGFMMSADGGRSWRKLADGIGGPVDFHHMDVSPANPDVIYGVYGDLQRSEDAGRTWKRVGPAPEGLIDLAASSRDANTLYAATQRGLAKSSDGGRSWIPMYATTRPATMIHVSGSGDIHAFIIGTGLVRAGEGDLRWEVLGGDLGQNYVLHLAVDPKEGRRMYAVAFNPNTKTSAVLASRDGGKRWQALPGL